MPTGTLWLVLAAGAVLVGLAVLAMAVGVIFKRPCLRGSCGGAAVRAADGTKLTCDDCPNKDKHAAVAR